MSSRAVGAARRAILTEFELRERVSLDGATRMLRSLGFARLRAESSAVADEIQASASLAEALGGYLPVRYFLHEAQEGYGRMKCDVMVDGIRAVPYVRMKRAARACLAGEHHWDVDMVNCQPALLEQKLRKYDIACPLLTKYVTERDACLREVSDACGVTRDEAKQLFLRLTYFGGLRGWFEAVPHARAESLPGWISDLIGELRCSVHALLKHPKQRAARGADPHRRQRGERGGQFRGQRRDQGHDHVRRVPA